MMIPLQGSSSLYRAFSHDVTAAILVFQNNEMAAMLVSQQNPLGVERLSHVNDFFCSNKQDATERTLRRRGCGTD